MNSNKNFDYTHTSDYVTSGYTLTSLDFIFFLSIFLAMLVIISKNPVVSVLYLIGLFFSIACYLILLGISFVGLSYLLVYVGAVSILFLFILMLINVRISELITENTNSIPLIITIPVLFHYSVQKILTIITLKTYENNIFDINILYSISYDNINYINSRIINTLYVTSNIWDGSISATTHIASIGNIMYTNYSLWLILISIILLLSMVGSIVITLKKDK